VWRPLAEGAKAFLRRRDRLLLHLPLDQLSGVDLEHDLRVLVPGTVPTCLDVGANQGQTIALFERALQGPAIHSFEPSPRAYQALSRQPRRQEVAIHNVAMGEHAGEREFIDYENHELSSFLELSPRAENPFRVNAISSRVSVRIDTVDAFVARHHLETIDVLKSDAQGTDLSVLRGAAQTLREGRVNNALVELNFVGLYENQSSPTEIIDMLASHGLHLVGLYERLYKDKRLYWCTSVFHRSS
jgi:FkbM family methyltransferase